jgi:hypothetical protein
MIYLTNAVIFKFIESLKALSIVIGQQVDDIKQQVIVEIFAEGQHQNEVMISRFENIQCYDLQISMSIAALH